jgi:hypothetical protein
MRKDLKNFSPKQKGKSHLEDLGEDGRIILNWILQKKVENVWTGFMCFRIGTSDVL